MSHRGQIAVRQQDGQYRLTHLHSCSYPATVWGDIAAGEILLNHHNSYAQALAISAIPEIREPKAAYADMLSELSRLPLQGGSLESCQAQAQNDIHIEDLYIHDGREWFHWKPRRGDPPRPLTVAVARAKAEEWAEFDRRNPEKHHYRLKSGKPGKKPRHGRPPAAKIPDAAKR